MSRLYNILNKIAGHAVVETGGTAPWSWVKYSDGTFEAWRVSDAGSTGSLTQIGSSGVYYSVVSEFVFPSEIGITSVKSCAVAVMPTDNYIMGHFINRLTNSSVYFAFLRFGSGTAVSNIKTRIHITGTYS